MKKEFPDEFKRGEVVIARYGWNNITKAPFQFLYEFGYYSAAEGKCIVYNHGECNMQDAHCFDVSNIRKATEKDLEEYFWGH